MIVLYSTALLLHISWSVVGLAHVIVVCVGHHHYLLLFDQFLEVLVGVTHDIWLI